MMFVTYGGEAVVDEEMCAVDEAGFVAREKECGARHFFRFAQAALLDS
jgi:hypothetical protein